MSERGDELPLGGSRQRALLAVLLVHRRERVSIDQLVDALWGDAPPPTATKTIQVYVSRLRRTFGDGVLETRDRGYRLAADPSRVDADRFEALLREGRSALDMGEPRRAVEALTAAQAEWSGAALPEFADEPFARAEIDRLEGERIAASEARLTAELQLGKGRELVGELEQLTAAHPLREGLVAALMLALYRAGRQADALATYRAARRRLVDELGLEPGPELRELERRILEHDPALAGSRAVTRAVTSRPATRVAVSVAIAVVALLAAGLVLRSETRSAPHSRGLAGRDGLVVVNAASGALVSSAALAGPPAAVASSGRSAWAAEPGDGIVSRVQTSSSGALDRIAVGGEPGAVVTGAHAVWAASTVGATVRRIDPDSDAVTQTISLPGSSLSALAIGAGRVWAADAVAREIFGIDEATGALRQTISLDVQPSALAIAGGDLWVAGYDRATLEQVDPSSGRTLGRVRVGNGPAAVTSADGALWVANSLDSTVSRVDPSKPAVSATIPVRAGASAIAAAGGSVWVASRYSHDVARLDTHRNRVADASPWAD